jgi:signal transduction histidine kinase
LLTLVILAGFAGAADLLIERQVSNQFVAKMNYKSTLLPRALQAQVVGGEVACIGDLYDFAAADNAQIRLFSPTGRLLCSQQTKSDGVTPLNKPAFTPPLRPATYHEHGYRVNVQPLSWRTGRHERGHGWLVYGQPLSSTSGLISNVRLFLSLGVVGGAILALLAGLYVARRAMLPITELTDAAREIELTRDPTLRIPQPEADDEISELARTLEGMLGALNAARTESETALARQREFVADASHELRTPLTAVLANLELLADELDGEQADSAKSALRSTRRMRRLVGDLLLLARADAQRTRPLEPTDLAEVLTDAAGELGAVAESHFLMIDPSPAVVLGNRDDLHRLALNLIDNALSHTAPGTSVNASTGVIGGVPTLIVEDDGPGIPPEMRQHVFDRFVRVGGDSGGGGRGTGLGLAIVRAVANEHEANVTLTTPVLGTGTRFEITFPQPPSPKAGGVEPQDQTSTTTGSTIGRRRSRS